MKTIRIVTKTARGEVRTQFSDDPFHNFNTWQSSLIVPDMIVIQALKDVGATHMAGYMPMIVVDAFYTDTYEEAGKAHLKLCERLK